MDIMPTLTCKSTGKTIECKVTKLGNPKLPKGWKWRGDAVYSKEAWNSLYCLRAITVPIVSPVCETNSPDALKEAWTVLNEQLKDAWQHSTEAANWACKYLWSHDVTRQQDDDKCPTMAPVYLYGLRDWSGWSQSAGAVLRTVEAQYRKKRYEIVWTGSSGVPNVRYPYPYPIHNASWELVQESGGQITFGCRLPSGRITVRVRTKNKPRTRIADLKHLIDNPDLRGEASLIKKHDGTIMVKMVGWFPKTVRVASGELWVRTSAIHLLTLFNEKEEELQKINGDWIRQKVLGHEAMLQRWHDDMKLERRLPKRLARKTKEDIRVRCDKMHARLKTFIDQTAAQIVNYAIRRKLDTIRYDDSEKGYFTAFPWFKMKERLEVVCNRENVKFEGFGAEPDSKASRKKSKSRKVDSSTLQ